MSFGNRSYAVESSAWRLAPWVPLALCLMSSTQALGAEVTQASQDVAQSIKEVHYLAAAPRAEVDAFGFLATRATTRAEDESGVSLLLVQGNAEGHLGAWSVRGSLRLLMTEFLPLWQEPNLFFQELYASWRQKDELVQVKAGKLYQRFGRDWDYGFSGPLLFGNDLKLRPDVGVGVEGTPQLTDRIDLQYALQYFVADGENYGSLTKYRWGSDVRHRHTVVANVAPGMRFDSGLEARVGASAKVGQSRLSADGQGATGIVRTLALDVDTRFRDAGAFIEVGRQFDDSTNLTSADINFDTNLRVPAFTYVWMGAKYEIGKVRMRLSYNDHFYADRARETLVLPGVSYVFNEHVELMAEFNLWLTNNLDAAGNTQHSRFRDRSLYIVLSANI